MAGEQGKKQIKHTPQQKAELVEQICLLYESQQVTINSCCEACGITDRTFYLWCAENSELSERYKKAKEIQDADFWEKIKPLQKRALERHLEVEFAEEESDVVFKGIVINDPITNKPLRQKTTKAVLPNPSVLIFSMKGTYPDKFADRQQVTHSGEIKTGFDISKLTDDEAGALLALMEKAKNG